VLYYTLQNIPAKYRARVDNIQVIAIADAKDTGREGLEGLLADFLNGIRQLAAEGIEIEFAPGLTHTFHGFLIGLIGDTLAVQDLLGMKIGVGFAFRPCRNCFGDHDGMQGHFMEADFQIRHLDLHRAICEMLDELNAADRVAFSTFVGVNGASILDDVPHFDLINMSPHDSMHIIIEGGLSHELRLLLNQWIFVDHFFTVAQLNDRIAAFDYGYMERSNKPSPITADQIQRNVTGLPGQKASQIWLLARSLMLLVNDLVPAGDLFAECWEAHLRILFAALAPEVHPQTPVLLTQLIEDHHQLFILRYPQVQITPKLHYYVHIPGILLRSPLFSFFPILFFLFSVFCF